MGKRCAVKVLECVLHSEKGSVGDATYAILECFLNTIRFSNHLLEETELSENYGRMS